MVLPEPNKIKEVHPPRGIHYSGDESMSNYGNFEARGAGFINSAPETQHYLTVE
jgi:hypothetical protein